MDGTAPPRLTSSTKHETVTVPPLAATVKGPVVAEAVVVVAVVVAALVVVVPTVVAVVVVESADA